jgi:hypothetical protein
MSTALAARSPATAAKAVYADAWSGLWPYVSINGPMAAAERAWHPGHRCASVAELEAEIRERLAGARQKTGAA